MSDLNDWVLTVDGVALEFGTASTNYPFAVQMEVAETARTTQDAAHPTSDGLVMGRDRLQNFVLQFQARILQEYPLTAKPWMHALDLYRQFAAAWRADAIRNIPGAYAQLANTERGVLVYGRPRAIAPKHSILRRGYLDFQFDFETNSPDFYSTTEKSVNLTVEPPSLGGFSSPLVNPIVTTVSDDDIAETINAGDLPAWPVIEFHGPGASQSVELFDGVDLLWEIGISRALKVGEVLIVDTRPWQRGAVVNDQPANGLLRGSQLEMCKIPVGTFDIRYRVTDVSGTAFATVKWRDTYASL